MAPTPLCLRGGHWGSVWVQYAEWEGVFMGERFPANSTCLTGMCKVAAVQGLGQSAVAAAGAQVVCP